MRETKRNLEEAVIPDVLKVMYDFGAFGTKDEFSLFVGASSTTQAWRWTKGKTEPKAQNLYTYRLLPG